MNRVGRGQAALGARVEAGLSGLGYESGKRGWRVAFGANVLISSVYLFYQHPVSVKSHLLKVEKSGRSLLTLFVDS